MAANSARRATVAGTTAAALMIAAQVGGKATRDALFLDAFDASDLPKAMLASAVLSGLGVFSMAQALAHFGPRLLVPLLFAINAALFVAEHAMLDPDSRYLTVAIYLHVSVLGALLISGFWTLVSERFDPHSAKKAVGRMNAGATAGGLVGGLVAERVASWLDAGSMLLVLAGMSLTCALALTQINPGGGPQEETSNILEGFKHLSKMPYLKLLGMLVMLTAASTGLMDYAFKAEAEKDFTNRESMLSFFGLFYTATSLLTFLIQAALSRPLLARLGLGGTVATLPGMTIVTGIVALTMPRLTTLVAMRGSSAVLINSLYRSGYELLFTPLSPEKKRSIKTVIDVGFDRVGDILGSAAVLIVLALIPAQSVRLAVALAMLTSAISLWTAFRLHNGYVSELATSLREGRVDLAESEVVDATTKRTLADTTMAIDREKLLQQIDELRASDASEPREQVAVHSLMPDDEVAEALEDLVSGEPERVRRVLRPPIDPRLLGLVIPMLGDDRLGRAARRALRQSAPRCLGQLVDAVLDDKQAPAVRRRLPDILSEVPDRRAADGLFRALASDLPEVRERSASALRRLVETHPELAPPASEVFELIEQDVTGGDVSLSRIVTLLSLVLEAEPLRLAFAALRSADENLRGTSLEYLDNILPDSLRSALSPVLEREGGPRSSDRKGRQRSREELLEQLQRSRSSLELDREELKRSLDSLDED